MEPIKLGRYRHFKGNEYEVVGLAKHSETLEDMVVYRALYGEFGLWVRPAAMWNEIVERDGKTYRREMTDYTLVRSRRRTLSMELKRDGTVVVHAPLRLGVEKIDAFVAAHEAWLARARARQAERLAAHPEPTEAEREALLARARSELPQRVAHWSRVTGLVPTGVKITGAKTRFGSCNGRNSLCFSWRLMQYPDEAIDLVVVHELCHIAHHDHGPGFYALLGSILPDHRERMKLLKE